MENTEVDTHVNANVDTNVDTQVGHLDTPTDALSVAYEDYDSGRDLNETKIYPQGRIFPMMGYSGDFDQDKARGFTVAGHAYSKQSGQLVILNNAMTAGQSYVYGVGLDGTFIDKTIKVPTQAVLKKTIMDQVKKVAALDVCWWYVKPEELRYWMGNELTYLRVVTDAIREADPLKRPIMMYEPNHRNASALVKTCKYQDIVGKGTYVNWWGVQNNRVWVRWSIEQEVNAINQLNKLDTVNRIPISVLQMSADPAKTYDSVIPRWIRHDCYLSLLCGAKGIMIWSLAHRASLTRTYNTHYNTYATIATELTGSLGLGQVFLFGKEINTIACTQTSGATTASVVMDKVTTTHQVLTVKTYCFRKNLYFFATNSSNGNLVFTINNLTSSNAYTTLFSNVTIKASGQKKVVTMPSWGALCLKITT
jgi:hypothetical protein